MEASKAISPSSTISFADVAHQTLIFDSNEEPSRLILSLLDTPWVQRLRRIRQTGYTLLVYMFSEHSRFGHSLGVAYLANRLMKNLAKRSPELVRPYMNAVAAAALLHDIGHVAPGSHLAERLWVGNAGAAHHESLSIRIVREDGTIRQILESFEPGLPELVARILSEDPKLPQWTKAIISGGGWNADRGNWAIVDSAMCSVSYGRYNVFALLDSFRISPAGELVLQESRVDALTHFFVARDSMYRQVYQHRVLQAADALCEKLVLRLRDLAGDRGESALAENGIYADETLKAVLWQGMESPALRLDTAFDMTESWWNYHLERWCGCGDAILRDLSQRIRDRRLLKTIRLGPDSRRKTKDDDLVERTEQTARELGFDPRYYVARIENADKHRNKKEEPPKALLDNGEIVPVTSVEPLIAMLLRKPARERVWLAVPKEVKDRLGRLR